MSIVEELQTLQDLNICIIGETINDIFIDTKSLSTPHSYPYTVVEEISKTQYLGGAYTVAQDLANFSNNVTLFTNSSASNGTKAFEIIALESRDVNKTRFVDHGSGATQYFSCEWPSDEEWTANADEIDNFIAEKLSNFDLTIVIDYGHGLISNAAAINISKHSKRLALNCQANGGRHPFHQIWRYPSFHMVVLNEYEARLNMGKRSVASQGILAREIGDKSKAKFSILTDAARGAWLAEGNSVFHQRSLAANITDAIGCGDIMLGFCAMAMARNLDAQSQLYIGSLAAAAKSKMKIHERPLFPKDILDEDFSNS